MQVPSVLPRLVEIPASGENERAVILLEEIIERNIDKLFLSYDVVCAHPYRIMRNADLSIDEDVLSLEEAMTIYQNSLIALLDIGIHYAYRGRKSSGFGMSGLLVYIIILGVYALKETKNLLRQGQNAKIFKHMAYHDELTGVYSRAAYMNLVRDIHFVKEGTSVVMCDLNNLKQCNDTKGHQAGDRYLKESARLIQSVFDGSGNCYRMGGDEFCVVMQDTDKAGYLNLIGRLKDACEAYNKEKNNF